MVDIAGETKIPNWMLALFILGLTAGWGVVGGVIIQDRGRVYENAEAIGAEKSARIEADREFALNDARHDLDIKNLMSMWSDVKKQLDRIESRMP